MRILYFAWIREKVGTAEEDVTPPDGVATLSDLVTWLRDRGGAYSDAFADDAAIRAAVNQEYATLDHKVSAGDEIAFFPPVTGG